MRIDFPMKTRAVLAELSRREAATLRVTISTKSGNSDVTKELVEHAIFLETTADALMTSFEPDKTAATIVARGEDV